LLHGVSPLEVPLTAQQRATLRRKGVMVATTTARGVYISPGGGMSASGRSTKAIIEADMWMERVIATLQSQEEDIRTRLSLQPGQNFAIAFTGNDLNVTASVAKS
jgi:hypothetical protein